MSTAIPQLIHILSTWLPLVVSLAACGLVFYYGRKNLPSKLRIDRLAGDISDLSSDLVDLRDRFVRFQKRDGMRAAREQRQTEKELVDQAQTIVAQGGAQEGSVGRHPKAGLYRGKRN